MPVVTVSEDCTTAAHSRTRLGIPFELRQRFAVERGAESLRLNDDMGRDLAGGDVFHFSLRMQRVIDPSVPKGIFPLWVAFFGFVDVPAQRDQNGVDEGLPGVFLKPDVQIKAEVVPLLDAVSNFRDGLPNGPDAHVAASLRSWNRRMDCWDDYRAADLPGACCGG